MTNGRYVDIENEVLRGRLDECKAALNKLAGTVRRYVEPKKGDDYCSRSEILRITEAAEQTARGGGEDEEIE